MYTSSIPAVSAPAEASFKGKPVITLPDPDDSAKPGIQFGVRKCRAFLANAEAVKAFVGKHHKPASKPDYSGIIARLRAMGKTEAEIKAIVGE